MNILICSQRGEVQVDEVKKKLDEAGFNAILFERYRKDQFITYHYNGRRRAALRIEGQEYSLDSDTFPVVWYRPKPVLLSELPGENGSIEEKFCAQEWRSVLRSLDAFLSESKWVNSIWHSQRASCKTYQLKLASELGLSIPETIITNDANQTIKLFDSRVIYKTLSSFITASHAIYTNEITLDDVLTRHAEISMAPGIFQKYIEKSYELRITIVGEKMFIARINSQLCEETSVDWRRNPNSALYEVGNISDETKVKLMLLHKTLGLVYAAYDFIVDKNGNEIFLECNPSGQWLWLENALGLEISDMMVEEFCSMKSRRNND